MSFAKAFVLFSLMAAASQASAKGLVIINNEAGPIQYFVLTTTPNYQYTCTGVDWNTQCQRGNHTETDGWYTVPPHGQASYQSNNFFCVGVNYGGDWVASHLSGIYAFGLPATAAWVAPNQNFAVGYTMTGHQNDAWVQPVVINGQHQQEGGGGLDWNSRLAYFQAIGLQQYQCVYPNANGAATQYVYF